MVMRSDNGAWVETFIPTTGRIRWAEWDPKGRFVAFIDDDGNLFLWQIGNKSSRYIRMKLQSHPSSLAISPDGGQIAVAETWGIELYTVQ